jgi:hypothetical protein
LPKIDRESLTLSQHPRFLRIIAVSRAEIAAGRTLTLEQMKRAVSPKQAPGNRIRRKSRRS